MDSPRFLEPRIKISKSSARDVARDGRRRKTATSDYMANVSAEYVAQLASDASDNSVRFHLLIETMSNKLRDIPVVKT